MQFESLIGQPVAHQILAAGLSQTRTSHAYLFYGPAGTGKTAGAIEFARALCGGGPYPHPDIMVYEPDGASFKIEQARKLQKDLALSPLSGNRRIAILKHIEKMTTEAANSLLKVLEDPPGKAVLILLAKDVHNVLPTVLSRCQVVPFRPAPLGVVQEYLVSQGVDSDRASALAALSGGIVGKALEMQNALGEAKSRLVAIKVLDELARTDPWTLCASMPQDRVESIEVLSFIAWFLRDALAKSANASDAVIVNVDMLPLVNRLAQVPAKRIMSAIDEVSRARRRIEANCNVGCVLELMLMKMSRILTLSGS